MENKPQGWASLTRLRDSNSTAVASDPFPALSLGENSGVAARRALLQAPFVSVVSKGLLNTTAEARRSSPEDVLVARLREQHGWADDVMLRDVLRAVDGDEAMAGQQLDAMAATPLAEASAGDEGDEFCVAGAVEREENDVYLMALREALRLSRARGKYARGAHNAYMAGDHANAKEFSRVARENFKSAEKLHAQAAEEILYSKNADGHVNMWSLDLHGLHAPEAVLALQERLAYLENELAINPASLYKQSQRPPDGAKVLNEQPLPLVASRAVVKNELSVITGVGRHSKGGPSLPLAVKNFLLSQGYKFREAKPGRVSVTPKRHYT